ncbi:cytochrome P450 [Acrasis kona]|uniref:Cytochrome P450 n=1 Tax=Acrasis kona TaxID=1008807 RepID=A0AAW2YTH9_9EUKA
MITVISLLLFVPVVLITIYYILHLLEVRRVQHIPGVSYPHALWLFLFAKHNNFFMYPRDQIQLSNDLKDKKVWRITLGRDTWVFTKDPEVIREICVTKHKDYRRDKNWKKANMVNTRGNVLVSHGDEWKQHRLFLNPSFSDVNMKNSYDKTIIPTVETIFNRWDNKIKSSSGEVNASYDLSCLVADVFGQVAMSLDYGTVRDRNLNENVEPLMSLRLKDVTFVTQFLVLFPWGTNLAKFNPKSLSLIPVIGWILEKVSKTTRDWRGMLVKAVEDRCSGATTMGSDILSVLSKAILDPFSRESDTKFDKEDIVSELHVLASAGLETTTHTLEWVLYYMARNLQVQNKLVQDIKDTVKSNPINYESLCDPQLFKYVHAVINETLRMRGPVPNIWRYTRVDTVLAGKTIPKDTHVYPMFCLVNKDKEIWGGDADTFKPERFLDANIKPHVFSPFSFGPRACVGKKLAEIQLMHVVVSIFNQYKISLPESESIADEMEERMAMTMGPKDSVYVVVSKRN